MQTFIIRENPLTDDKLYIAGGGKCFTGNSVAILEYFTPANEWSDRRNIRKFRTIEAMQKYLSKHYTGEELETLS